MEASIMQAFESIRCGFLDVWFSICTFFGQEMFLVAAIAVLYWAVNKKLGEFLLVNALTASALNGAIKDVVKRPRPYMAGVCSKVDVDNFFVSTNLDNSYSFPSGHSMTAGVFFTGLALNVKKRSITMLSIVLIALVMLSRVYLGVHYPTDVLTGAALGVVIAFAWNYVYEKHYDKRTIIILIVAVVCNIFLIFAASTDTAKALGALSGAALGLFLEDKFVKFDTNIPVWKKIIRVAVGILLVLGVRAGLKAVFDDSLFLSYLRYFLMIFVVAFPYPLLFKKIGF